MDEIKKKVVLLIIEDEKILSDTLEEKLVLEGFDVIKAFDGDEGLKLALTDHPDLILLDLLMPKVDGITVFKKIREDSWGAHAPVVILTNVNSPSKVSEAMAVNSDDVFDYLVKTSTSLDSIISHIKKRLNINNK